MKGQFMPATLADIQRKYGESVYPLYKDQMHEPYMENDNGIGYKGVVIYDELEDKVQCAECGEWFNELGKHVVSTHGFKDSKEYKQKQGMYLSTPLCSPSVSKKISDRTKGFGGRIKGGHNTTKGVKPTHHRTKSMMYKNKYGLCDAQVAARLAIVRDMANGELTSGNVRKYDQPLYKHILVKYGTVEAGCAALGIKPSGWNGRNEVGETLLIADLRKYVISQNRIPSSKDNGLPHSPTTYRKVFGSWRRAKMMAGLDQLLAEVKGE